jgi:hypothetical protein
MRAYGFRTEGGLLTLLIGACILKSHHLVI